MGKVVNKRKKDFIGAGLLSHLAIYLSYEIPRMGQNKMMWTSKQKPFLSKISLEWGWEIEYI